MLTELRKKGVFVSPSGTRSIWLRNNLESFKERLNALEKKSAAENFILTEAQIAALERKKDDDIACGEIETAHPGYLGSQDTFYVGTLKGVGRFINKHLSIRTLKLLIVNSIQQRLQLHLLIY